MPAARWKNGARRTMALHVFAWRPGFEMAGFARGALFLLRPDTYVALADPSGSAEALQRNFSDRTIRP